MSLIYILIILLIAIVLMMAGFSMKEASKKDKRKEQILALLNEKSGLSNLEIRKALGVSSRTAVRYLDEMEKEGKVEQIGKIGQAVTYRLK